MTTLQYEDSNYRQKQLQKEKDDYAIEFGKWILRNFKNYGPNDEKELLEIFKKEKQDAKERAKNLMKLKKGYNEKT